MRKLITTLALLLVGSAALAQTNYFSLPQTITALQTWGAGGVPVAAGGHPTLTTGSCSGSTAVGGLLAGSFTGATCTGGTYILSGLPTVTTGYACDAVDQTLTTDLLVETATTTTSVTFTGTTATGNIILFKCPMAY